MNYGNTCALSNKVLFNQCLQCKENIDKHTISVIQSDDETVELARKVQQNLDKVYQDAKDKGYTPADNTMVGAAIATIDGSRVVKVVALSGFNASWVLSLMPKNLGKDVVIVGDNVLQFETVTGEAVRPNIADIPRGFNFKLGTCAAQKVLMEIIRQGKPQQPGGRLRISNLRMAEIFWKTNDTKSNWSSGDVVPSCDTCKRLVPMLLCDKCGD
jgi:hypothetical protein